MGALCPSRICCTLHRQHQAPEQSESQLMAPALFRVFINLRLHDGAASYFVVFARTKMFTPNPPWSQARVFGGPSCFFFVSSMKVHRSRTGLRSTAIGNKLWVQGSRQRGKRTTSSLAYHDHRQRLTQQYFVQLPTHDKYIVHLVSSFDHPNVASFFVSTISLLRGESANIYIQPYYPTTVKTASLRSFLHMVGRVTTLDSLFVVTAAAAVQRTIASITTAREEKHHGDEPQGKPDCRKVEGHPEGISNVDAVPEGGCEIVVHLVDCKSAEIGNNTRLQSDFMLLQLMSAGTTQCRERPVYYSIADKAVSMSDGHADAGRPTSMSICAPQKIILLIMTRTYILT